MTVYVWALLIGALVVAAINYNNRVALRWIALGAINFALTYLYAFNSFSWLPHAAVTGAADAVLVYLLIRYREHRWEKLVQWCFALSVLVSIAHLAGWIGRPDHAIGLEICNWLALLVMGGHGILRLADEATDGVVGQAARAGPRGYLHRARMALDAPRRTRGIFSKAAR